LKKCAQKCLQLIDTSTSMDDDTIEDLIDDLQSIPTSIAANKPYTSDHSASRAQGRSDQFYNGGTELMAGGGEAGEVFASSVPINGQDKWTEEWVITTDLALLTPAHGSGVSLEFRYKDASNDAAGYILGQQTTAATATAAALSAGTQPPPAPKISSMSVDFYYEEFDLTKSPVKDLPHGFPNSLTQVNFDVFTADITGAPPAVSGQKLTGKLFRLYKNVVNPQTGVPGVLHVDHWALFTNYVLPSDASTATILKENGKAHASAWAFAEDAALAAPAANNQTAMWFVRTQAVYEQV
jgi:hypothetical protein